MTLHADLVPTVDHARTLVENLGLRPWSVRVRRRTWSGGAIGVGVASDDDSPIQPAPKVVWPEEGRLARQGQWEKGDVTLKKLSRQASLPWLLGTGLPADTEHLLVLVHGESAQERTFRPIGHQLQTWDQPLVLVEVAGLVEWKTRGSRSFDPARGQVSYAETTQFLRATFGALSLKELEKSGAKAGDVRVLVLAQDGVVPRPEDRFVFDGTAYNVYAVEENQRKTFFLAYGRR